MVVLAESGCIVKRSASSRKWWSACSTCIAWRFVLDSAGVWSELRQIASIVAVRSTHLRRQQTQVESSQVPNLPCSASSFTLDLSMARITLSSQDTARFAASIWTRKPGHTHDVASQHRPVSIKQAQPV